MCWKTPQEAFLTNILGGSKSSQTDTTEKVKCHKYPFCQLSYDFKLLVDKVGQQKDGY